MDQNKKSLDDRQFNELSLDGSGSEVRSPGYATSMVRVDLAAATHPGHVRENNEDHYLTVRFRRSLETLSTNVVDGVLPASFDETGYGMLVADGVGGTSGGEVASRLALCKLVELVVNTPDWHMKLNQKESVETVTARIT
jgi:serine/threonine protein phosphatase PrpC